MENAKRLVTAATGSVVDALHELVRALESKSPEALKRSIESANVQLAAGQHILDKAIAGVSDKC